MATENIKTVTDVITEFLDNQAKEKFLNADTVGAVSTLWKDDDLSKVKLLRKLEETRKAARKADVFSADEAGDD